MFDPEPVQSADYLVMESTYGDRVRERTDPAGTLADVIGATVDRGAPWWYRRSRWAGRRRCSTISGSCARPEGCRTSRSTWTARWRSTPASYWAPTAKTIGLRPRCTRACARWRPTPGGRRVQEDLGEPEPKVVISASGMATGAESCTTSRHSRRTRGTRSSSPVIRCPEPAGDPSRPVSVRSGSTASGSRSTRRWPTCRCSPHADADELIRWAAGFTTAPRQVFVVHGEPQPADTLRSRLGREFGWQATVPRPGQVFGL